MVRGIDKRIDDVREIVNAARGLVDRRAQLAPALVASTGLSAAGVELALTKHLELDPTQAELRQLVAHAGDASKVAVILSSNVFVGALRAIAIARAASCEVTVRPSRRDPAFARALVQGAASAAIRLDESLDVADVEEGEIHIYGHDETIAALRARARAGVRIVGHGSGLGIAWLSRDAVLADAARDLADDVVVFDQRGCMSPRIAFVEGPFERAEAFAESLHAELERLGELVPRGRLSADERAASERYVATMTYASRVFVGHDHAVGVAPPGAPMIPCPAHRHVHVAACTTEAEALTVIAPLSRSLVAVGSDDVVAARRLAPSWARVSVLGCMQRPPLDGPVDRRPGTSAT
ncbi:MAG TPA: acyl-CoA reductase [Labilithrix sp.]|nr:acyl-CoA reductase [Labilithrix sp.]